MSIERTTTHLCKYRYMQLIEQIIDQNGITSSALLPEQESKPLYIQFGIRGNISQRSIAQKISSALNSRAVYHRDKQWRSIYNRGNYEVSGWIVSARQVTSRGFELNELQSILEVLGVLRDSGHAPEEEIRICLNQEQSRQQVINLITMFEAKKKLIESALQTEEEIRIIVDRTISLSITLGVFDLPKIEAAICLMHQMAIQATNTRRIRMKAVEVVNARYQLRTWLLRLGFIGEEFASVRHTLLKHLDGNAAFLYAETGRRNDICDGV